MEQGWLRAKEAAVYSGVSKRTMSDWLKQGLPHSRVGGCVLIKVEHIDNWIEKQSVELDAVDRIVSEIMDQI